VLFRQLAHVNVPPSGFVTTTLVNLSAADGALTLIVIWVALVKVVEFQAKPPPAPVKVTVVPAWNPAPVMVTFTLLVPLATSCGLPLVGEVIVGPAFTVNPLVRVPVPLSGLVTVTSRAPVAAPAAMVMLAVTWVALFRMVELTVIPAPENDCEPGAADEPGSVHGDVLVGGALSPAGRRGRRDRRSGVDGEPVGEGAGPTAIVMLAVT
jgi:hypothetical protein